MKPRLWLGPVALLVVGLMTSSCGNSATDRNPTTTTTPSTSSPTGSSPSTSAASSPSARNLPITDSIRAQLVAAGAGLNKIPVAEYTGLAPGLTYYALDEKTNVHWAAARLQPAPTANPSAPSQAQIASQDAGSYYVFQQPPGSAWTAYAAGNTGPNTPCPVTVPPEVLQVWGWPIGSCRPNGV